jgi:hypothetical protein
MENRETVTRHTWTTQAPTKPGEYLFSIRLDKTGTDKRVHRVAILGFEDGLIYVRVDGYNLVLAGFRDDILWAEDTLPSDPWK